MYFFRVLRQQFGYFRALKSEYFLGFSKNVSDEHTYHFYIKSAPLGFWLSPQVNLRRFMKGNNYLKKFDTYQNFLNDKRIRLWTMAFNTIYLCMYIFIVLIEYQDWSIQRLSSLKYKGFVKFSKQKICTVA